MSGMLVMLPMTPVAASRRGELVLKVRAAMMIRAAISSQCANDLALTEAHDLDGHEVSEAARLSQV
jgi:hypothetical protein